MCSQSHQLSYQKANAPSLTPSHTKSGTPMGAQLLPSRLTLCDPEDCNPPGSFVCGILQARTLERVAISFSRGSSPPRDQTPVSCISCIGRRVLGSPCIHMHILFFLKFFSHLGCYTLLIRNAAHLFLVARTFTIQLLLVSERPF